MKKQMSIEFHSLIFAVLFYLFPSTSSDINRRQYDHIEPSFSNTYETNYFCFKVHQRIENEKMNEQLNLVSQQNIRLTLPIFLNSTRQQSNEIPYRYSTWQSSPNLPRRLTPCDHYVYTELLSILDQFFRRHQIEYLMVAGTLLGKN
ncbi:hypothetical protein I4U23_008827 [Adineta vaga]|nr:hypothetical protein I4U23_008827 [Adineta vaga]